MTHCWVKISAFSPATRSSVPKQCRMGSSRTIKSSSAVSMKLDMSCQEVTKYPGIGMRPIHRTMFLLRRSSPTCLAWKKTHCPMLHM